MLGNNNDRVIRRLAEKSVRNNRNRSLILAAAVALASFMLFSVFTVGLTWLDMYQLQILKKNGAFMGVLSIASFVEDHTEEIASWFS